MAVNEGGAMGMAASLSGSPLNKTENRLMNLVNFGPNSSMRIAIICAQSAR